MLTPHRTETRRLTWLRPALFGLAVLILIGLIGLLAMDLARKLDKLDRATSDNVEWQLSQMEVEYLGLVDVLENTRTAADLPELRRNFDIFYSRISTFREGMMFDGLRQAPGFSVTLDKLAGTLDHFVPAIDGPDSALLTALPEIRAEFRSHRPTIRQTALNGMVYFAERSDETRNSIAATLERVSAVTAGLIAALVGLVFVLWHFYRRAQFHSREAESSGARMTAVVETAPDGVIIADLGGIIRDFNDAAQRIFGYDRSEVIGRPMAETIVPQDARAAHEAGMKRFVETGEARIVGRGPVTVTARRKNGEEFPLELSLSTSHDAEGGAIVISFVRDITHRVAAEQELRVARDTALAGQRAKDRLLTVMSHEMRTPLNGMLATLELLEETGLNDRQRRYASIIGHSGETLLSHVNDVLDISRIDSGAETQADSTQIMDFGAIVRDIVDEQSALAQRNGSRVLADLPKATTVRGDPAALRRIFANLVGNAVKFTQNGRIEVSADRLGSSDMVEFRIKDTGLGIAPEDCARIFDDFVSLDASYGRSTSGTGLGLGIVQRLVRKLGGEITLDSKLGEGSLFRVRLPLPSAAEPAAARVVPAAPATPPVRIVTSEPLRILVVEDNEINRLVVREMLETIGHSVREAVDGIDGVQAAAARRYDLVLMDISMPRLDGVEATRRIRSGGGASCSAPIVALTANALPHEAANFRAAGMNDTVTKPISRKSLQRALDLATGRGGAPAAHRPKDGSGPVNLAQLDELRGEIGQARLEQMFGLFRSEADATVAWLSDAPAHGVPTAEALAAVHKLAGSAAVFGARSLHAHLSELDNMAKLGQLDQACARLPEISPIWADTVAAYECIDSLAPRRAARIAASG
jgi:PAS domain S-box-containing protein